MGPSYNLSPAKNLNCLAVQQRRLVPSNSKLSAEAFEVSGGNSLLDQQVLS